MPSSRAAAIVALNDGRVSVEPVAEEAVNPTAARGDGITMQDRAHATLLVEIDAAMAMSDDRLSFGRRADVVVDPANRFMHRRVGRFRRDNQRWWIDNLAHHHQLVMFGSDGTRRAIGPGMSRRLSAPVGTVAFGVGPALYALTYYSPAAARHGTTGIVDLTMSEMDILIELARPRLSGQGYQAADIADVAQATGVRHRTVDRLLDSLSKSMTADFIGPPTSIDELIVRLVAFGHVTLPQLIKRSVALDLDVPHL